jgi:hypothetical protein
VSAQPVVFPREHSTILGRHIYSIKICGLSISIRTQRPRD